MTVALIVPYYEDPDRLEGILYNDCTFKYFDRVIIVDDASPKHPAKPIVDEHLEECCCNKKKLSLYRIKIDYGFNAHGARNLGACIASNCEWLLFMDVDQELTVEFCESLLEEMQNCNQREFVLCNLFGEDPGNIFACRRSQFFEAGGYDEELRGYHMGDKIFRERLDFLHKPKLMTTKLPTNRMGRKVLVDDNVTGTIYPNDQTVIQRGQHHIEPIITMINERNKDPKSWKNIPKISFDWEREIQYNCLMIYYGEFL